MTLLRPQSRRLSWSQVTLRLRSLISTTMARSFQRRRRTSVSAPQHPGLCSRWPLPLPVLSPRSAPPLPSLFSPLTLQQALPLSPSAHPPPVLPVNSSSLINLATSASPPPHLALVSR